MFFYDRTGFGVFIGDNMHIDYFFASFIISLGILLVFLSVYYQRFSLYLFVFTLPLMLFLRVDFLPSTLIVIPGGLVVLSSIASVLNKQKHTIAFSSLIILSILLGIWVSFSTLYLGDNISNSRPYWLVIILLSASSYLLISEKHLLQVSWCWIISLSVSGLYVIITRILAIGFAVNIDANSLHATELALGDKNEVAMILLMGVPFSFYMHEYYRDQPKKRAWLMAATVIMGLGGLSTVSIGAFVGFCAMIFMFIMLTPNLKTRLRYIVISTFLLFGTLSGPILERLQKANLSVLDENWGSYRASVWSAGFKIILNYPVFGIGLDFDRRVRVMKQFFDLPFLIDYWYSKGALIAPHNILLSVGVETGLPGLMLYVFILIAAFISLFRTFRKHLLCCGKCTNVFSFYFCKMILVSLISSLIQGMALSVHLNKHIWLLLGFALALSNVSKKLNINSAVQ